MQPSSFSPTVPFEDREQRRDSERVELWVSAAAMMVVAFAGASVLLF
ncbi:MAG: hypothetical protein JNM08_16520 [Rubrivivax sp.]|nr:hypothetical protein [Rubrivivax sp.]